jgi:hypothetical protein
MGARTREFRRNTATGVSDCRFFGVRDGNIETNAAWDASLVRSDNPLRVGGDIKTVAGGLSQGVKQRSQEHNRLALQADFFAGLNWITFPLCSAGIHFVAFV